MLKSWFITFYKFSVTAFRMATQIAPTPIIKGKEAVKIYQEANRKFGAASKNGAEALKIKFSGKLKWLITIFLGFQRRTDTL